MPVLGKPAPHESAHLHVTGAARYVADDPGPPGTLFALPVPSPVACGRLLHLDASAARSSPGVHAVITAGELPGARLWGPIEATEPLLAEERVGYRGQAVVVVVAETEAQARAAAERVIIEIAVEEPVLTIEEAIARETFHTAPHTIQRGDLDGAMRRAAIVVSGELAVPGQDHFYLETQAALVLPEEDGTWRVRSSTQHPTEIQHVVADVLGIPLHRVICEVPRLGGGFGGKESQASPYAAYAALGAWATGRPCRCWLHRDQDMSWTGKRHPFLVRYTAAFANTGHILGFDAQLYSDGGWSLDLSGPVMDRALFHSHGAYHIPAVRLVGRVCATNTPSNTAFRGFGGPQGMLAIEEAIDAAGALLAIDPTELRRINLLGESPRDLAPFGQPVEENRLPHIVGGLLGRDYRERLHAVEAFNADSALVKRGLAFQPVCFGISFTASLLNQAGAMVVVYTDGTVQVNHGGTEMGQGLHTKIRAVAADALGVPTSQVRVMRTSTDKVPNTSATAASSGSDLNGAAVARACTSIRRRMAKVAATLLGELDPDELRFEDGQVLGTGERSIRFGALAKACWAQQVSLAATGHYATPGIAYDPVVGQGRPFFYFAFGGALAEVEVSRLTGEYRVVAVDILHDVGNPLVPSIDRGQVEGGFVQGMGWLTCEELCTDETGRLLTHGPSTYKIPAVGDVPDHFEVALLDGVPNRKVIGQSKAVGEPPFMLALSVVGALRAAIAAFHDELEPVELRLPATPEAVLRAIERTDEARGEEARELA
jgi:xanthine dehydrogenase large subunit